MELIGMLLASILFAFCVVGASIVICLVTICRRLYFINHTTEQIIRLCDSVNNISACFVDENTQAKWGKESTMTYRLWSLSSNVRMLHLLLEDAFGRKIINVTTAGGGREYKVVNKRG